MSKDVEKTIANLKLSVGTGKQIEQLCMIMAAVTLIAGVVCAIVLGKMPTGNSYSGGLYAEISSPLFVAYLASGVFGAVVWLVLSKIGTALRWLEAIGTANLLSGSTSLEADAPALAVQVPPAAGTDTAASS